MHEQHDQVKGTIETYNRSAEFFQRYWSDASMAELLERFQQTLPEGAQRVLDAGCGSGRDMRWLLEHGLVVVGGDLSRALLDVARRDVPQGHFVRLDLRHLPFVNGSFTGVWACASLLHLPREQMAPALCELARLLLPGGVLFLGMKRGHGEDWVESEAGRRFFTYVEANELRALLQAAGFRPLQWWQSEVWIDVLAQRG